MLALKEFAGPIRRIRDLMIIDRDVKDSLSMRIILHAPDDASPVVGSSLHLARDADAASVCCRIVRQKLLGNHKGKYKVEGLYKSNSSSSRSSGEVKSSLRICSFKARVAAICSCNVRTIWFPEGLIVTQRIANC